jgi:hypothetical protein
MHNISRIGDHSAADRPEPTDPQIGALVGQISRTVVELQRALVGKTMDGAQAAQSAPRAVPFAVPPGGGMDLQNNVRVAKNLLHVRKRIFGSELFAGPAWEILLQLFDAYTSQRTETVGQVSLGADLPCTTVLRWLNRLSDDGLVRLRDDHLDRRRRFAELTDSGVQLMTQYFSGAAPHLIAA